MKDFVNQTLKAEKQEYFVENFIPICVKFYKGSGKINK